MSADRIRAGVEPSYVGQGIDGARRSAAIAREEADTIDVADPRHDELMDTASAWEDRADALEALAARSRDRRRLAGAVARLERVTVLLAELETVTAWSGDVQKLAEVLSEVRELGPLIDDTEAPV